MNPTKSKTRKAKPSPRQPGKGTERSEVMLGDFPFVPVEHLARGTPVLVLDLSPEARERRVAIAKQAVETGPAFFTYGQVVRCVLASIGDTPAGEGRGK